MNSNKPEIKMDSHPYKKISHLATLLLMLSFSFIFSALPTNTAFAQSGTAETETNCDTAGANTCTTETCDEQIQISYNCVDPTIKVTAPDKPDPKCIGEAFSLTATDKENDSEGTREEVDPCDASNNTTTPIDISATITERKWVVSGPGGFSAEGTGLVAAFTPTEAGTGTVTWTIKGTSGYPCNDALDDSASVSFIVVEVASVTPECTVQCLKETFTFTVTTNPPDHEDLVQWSGGGTPPTGSGREFETKWENTGDGGNKEITATCGTSSETVKATVVEVVGVVTSKSITDSADIKLSVTVIPEKDCDGNKTCEKVCSEWQKRSRGPDTNSEFGEWEPSGEGPTQTLAAASGVGFYQYQVRDKQVPSDWYISNELTIAKAELVMAPQSVTFCVGQTVTGGEFTVTPIEAFPAYELCVKNTDDASNGDCTTTEAVAAVTLLTNTIEGDTAVVPFSLTGTFAGKGKVRLFLPGDEAELPCGNGGGGEPNYHEGEITVTKIEKIQFKIAQGGFQDVESTLYVCKDQALTLKAKEENNNSFATGTPIWLIGGEVVKTGETYAEVDTSEVSANCEGTEIKIKCWDEDPNPMTIKVVVVEIKKLEVSETANPDNKASNPGNSNLLICENADGKGPITLTPEITPDCPVGSGSIIWQTKRLGDKHKEHGTFDNGAVDTELIPTNVHRKFTVSVGCDNNGNQKLDGDEIKRTVNVTMVNLKEFTIKDASDSENLKTSTTSSEIPTLLICEAPVDANGNVPVVSVKLSIVTDPKTGVVKSRMLWRSTPQQGAAPVTGGFLGQAPQVTLDPNLNREYTFEAGCDGNANGTLEDNEVSRKIKVIVFKVLISTLADVFCVGQLNTGLALPLTSALVTFEPADIDIDIRLSSTVPNKVGFANNPQVVTQSGQIFPLTIGNQPSNAENDISLQAKLPDGTICFEKKVTVFEVEGNSGVLCFNSEGTFDSDLSPLGSQEFVSNVAAALNFTTALPFIGGFDTVKRTDNSTLVTDVITAVEWLAEGSQLRIKVKSGSTPEDVTVRFKLLGIVMHTEHMTVINVKLKQTNYPSSANSTDLGNNQTKKINEDGVAYITGTPSMPKLVAQIEPSVSTINIEWKLEIKSERSQRNTRDDLTFPATGFKNLKGNVPWSIDTEYADKFVGGKATLKYKVDGGAEKSFNFIIRGKNPKDATAKAHIQANSGGFAYLFAIVQHESRSGPRIYNQFNASGSLVEKPNFGSPDGWGIAQIEGANTTQVYEWKVNVLGAVSVLNDKKAATKRFFDAVKRTFPDEGEASIPPPLFVVPGTNSNFSSKDISTMILYNGASGTQRSRLKNAQGKFINFTNPWKFNANAQSGQKWSFKDNVNNYAKKIIHDEWEGNTNVQE